MTLEKIAAIIPAQIYSFWENCHDIEVINKAWVKLKNELESGVIPMEFIYAYKAEFELLSRKLDKFEPLHIKPYERNK